MQQRDSQKAYKNKDIDKVDIRKQMRESMVINVSNFDNGDLRTMGKLVYSCRVNDKIISHSEFKKKENNSIEKCRANTELFYQLKN